MKPVVLLLQGCGVSALIFFRLYATPIAHPSDLRMHTPVPLTNFALSILVNLLLAGIVLAFLGRWIGNSRKLRWLRFVLPGVLLALLVKTVGINGGARIRPALLIAVWLAVTLLVVLVRWKSRRGEEIVSNLTKVLLLGMGIFFLIVVAQLGRIAMWRPGSSHYDHLAAANAASIHPPRVVWIVFDELSYQQVFEDRYPALRLPNFDKLRETSTVFTDAQPAGNYTELAIPSILADKIIDRVDYTAADQLELGTASKALYPFDATETPFADARKHGFTTGVVGWYNPYCTILAPYLNLCYRTGNNEGDLPQEYGAYQGFWKDLATPWRHSFEDALHRKHKDWRVVRHLDTYRILMRHSDQALEQPNLDFILIHLPVPHPPGIYNRETRRLDDSGKRSYIDNLALTDEALGQMLTILQQSPRWKDTNVIVCGDHSWRTWLWSPTPWWTAEDEAASHGGHFDPRPMLMVHLAGQAMPATVNTPYPLLGVHDILDDLVDGKKPSFSKP